MSGLGAEEFIWSLDWESLEIADKSPAIEYPPSAPRFNGNPANPLAACPLTEDFFHAARSEQKLLRGQRIKFSELHLPLDFDIAVRIAVPSNMGIDITCLGLDQHDRLSDEQYFLYFNNKTTPCGAALLLGPTGHYMEVLNLKLARLPGTICRLIVVASIDGEGRMSELGPSAALVLNGTSSVAKFEFSGADYNDERSLILMEVYQKTGLWRVAVPAQGFEGGLAALIQKFGATAF